MPIVEIVVSAASTLTAAGAIATAGYARRMSQKVAENEDRSRTNQELLVGDPNTLPKNIVERLRELEDEMEA